MKSGIEVWEEIERECPSVVKYGINTGARDEFEVYVQRLHDRIDELTAEVERLTRKNSDVNYSWEKLREDLRTAQRQLCVKAVGGFVATASKVYSKEENAVRLGRAHREAVSRYGITRANELFPQARS